MFEKDAKTIAKDIYVHHFDDDVNYPEVLKAITVGVQKGAELAYNKANEYASLNARQYLHNDGSGFCTSEEEVEQAFLAGLKEGRPKWHNVADDDLPEDQKEYWCRVFLYESDETFNAFLWFDPMTKDFKFLQEIEDHEESSFKVKAWCELPQYTEEVD